jgi:hypothetical protein
MMQTGTRQSVLFSLTYTERFAPKSNIFVLPLAHLILPNLSSICESIYALFCGKTKNKETSYKDNIKIYLEEIERKVMN